MKLDDSSVNADYANFCRISGTPEELVLDFALNTQPSGTNDDPLFGDVKVTTLVSEKGTFTGRFDINSAG